MNQRERLLAEAEKVGIDRATAERLVEAYFPAPCAECRNRGFVIVTRSGGTGDMSWGGQSYRPCPNGCPAPILRNVS